MEQLAEITQYPFEWWENARVRASSVCVFVPATILHRTVHCPVSTRGILHQTTAPIHVHILYIVNKRRIMLSCIMNECAAQQRWRNPVWYTRCYGIWRFSLDHYKVNGSIAVGITWCFVISATTLHYPSPNQGALTRMCHIVAVNANLIWINGYHCLHLHIQTEICFIRCVLRATKHVDGDTFCIESNANTAITLTTESALSE